MHRGVGKTSSRSVSVSARLGWLGSLLWVLVALPPGLFAHAQELIYSEVRAPRPVVAVGEALSLEVVLLDAFSAPIAAPEPFDLSVEVYRDSRAGERLGVYELSLGVGETSVGLDIPTAESGLFSIVAVHPALVSRELFVQVYDPSGDAGPDLLALPALPGLARASPVGLAAEAQLSLNIVYANAAPYRANEGDRVRLQIFLTDAAGRPVRAPEDIEVFLTTGGSLTPERIFIPRGQSFTTAFLRSARAGLVDLGYRGASPSVPLGEGTVLEPVRFINTGLHLNLKPEASLIEPVTLAVQLLGVDGKPVNVKHDRTVTVSMVSGSRGNGVFKPVAEALIRKGTFEGRVTFIPTWPGRINLRASSANVASVDTAVSITPAWVWILLAVGGGVIGASVGLIYETPKTSARAASPGQVAARVLKRIFIGVVAGSLLYWAYLFGVLLPPSPNLILLHPFTAFFVTLLGAFAGLGVIAGLVRRFGLNV